MNSLYSHILNSSPSAVASSEVAVVPGFDYSEDL